MTPSPAPIERPACGAPDAPPLFLPDAPWPPYRFVPGHAPHPVAHAGGYRHGLVEERPPFVPHERWRESAAYLRGCDFFNRGWWWEAHEIWEALWHVVQGRDETFRALLQGLIQLSACALNRERGVDSGAERLLQSACALLARAGDRVGVGDDADFGARTIADDADASGARRVAGLDVDALCAHARAVLATPSSRVDGLYVVPR